MGVSVARGATTPADSRIDSVGLAQVLVVELALCYREMVRLMMGAAHQYANKAETANMLDFLRIGRGDGEKLPIRQGSSFRDSRFHSL